MNNFEGTMAVGSMILGVALLCGMPTSFMIVGLIINVVIAGATNN